MFQVKHMCVEANDPDRTVFCKRACPYVEARL